MKKATRYEDQLIQFCNSYREKIRKIKEDNLTTESDIKKYLYRTLNKENIFTYCFYMQSEDEENSGLNGTQYFWTKCRKINSYYTGIFLILF